MTVDQRSVATAPPRSLSLAIGGGGPDPRRSAFWPAPWMADGPDRRRNGQRGAVHLTANTPLGSADEEACRTNRYICDELRHRISLILPILGAISKRVRNGSFFQSLAWTGCLAVERFTDPVAADSAARQPCGRARSCFKLRTKRRIMGWQVPVLLCESGDAARSDFRRT